ncbi:MAG: dipeptidase [Alphaproteobacteria bacterium]|nr:dipeptidase [Alphaproteobacteria bacterium]
MSAAAAPAPAWRGRHPAIADAIVCDGLLPWTRAFLPPGADLGRVLKRFHTAGVDHISLTAAAGADRAAEALARIGFLRRAVAALGPWARLADAPEAVRQARADGALSVALHFQTATPFAGDLDLVDGFKAAGIGRAILAYNTANVFADGCHEQRNAGLSALGRRLIERMDAAGMVVDLSHCGERTSLDALEAPLERPPVFSHSNARALYDHERNITDAQIRACAARGGYVGVNGVGMFLGAEGAAIPRAMADQLAHIAAIAGADRVGLGLDFMYLEGSDYGFFHAGRGRWPRGYPEPPWSFLEPEQLGDLVDAIAAKGFSAAEMRGILGENYLRLAA